MGDVIHAHKFRRIGESRKRDFKWRMRLKLPVYVICPIREPLSRNVSAFFQNFKRDTGFEIGDREWNLNHIRELFLDNYPHNISIEWFDKNIRTDLGIDVYSKAFPIKRRWSVYRRGSLKMLVYRTDLDHSEQLKVVSQFLKFKIDRWHFSNISKDKEYGDLYKNFCKSTTLPKIYITLMNKSRFCRHFWNEEEIIANSRKWMA